MLGLFKKGDAPDAPPRDVAALASDLALPAFRIERTRGEARSYFLGTPALPEGVAWPEHEAAPLSLLACLDLRELRVPGAIQWLPDAGRLLFFYDLETKPWGFDPAESRQWRVLLLPEGLPIPAEEEVPSGIKVASAKAMAFAPFLSYPPHARVAEPLALSEEERAALSDLHAAPFGRGSRHQVGGYPSPARPDEDEMELECQLASNGVYCGDQKYLEDPRTEELRGGASEWRLLLQLDEDPALGLSWAGDGALYFWVQEEAARRGDFENVWVVLQRR